MSAPIIFLNRFYAPDHSATAQILTDLATDLAATGYEVTVIAGRTIYGMDGGLLPRYEKIDGVDVHRVSAPPIRRGMIGRLASYLWYLVLAPIAAWRLAKQGTVIVVKTDPPLLSVPLACVTSLRSAVLVQWLQDLYPEIAHAYGMRIVTGVVGRPLARLRDMSLRRSARLVAIGELMAARLRRLNIARAEIVVIPNWSDDAGVIPRTDRSPDLRATWKIAPDAFVLAYSGNLGRAHEYDTLLAAASRLRENKNIVFLFVGGGHMLERLRADVLQQGLTAFRFAPYQARERLSESLGLGDAHWISLRPEFEGLIVPSKVFGICAAGRAIISIGDSNGEIAGLLKSSGAGFAIAAGDDETLAREILKLANSPDTTAGMGIAARKLLDDGYTRGHALARWRALLDGLADDIADPYRERRPRRRR